jgi:amidase
MVGSGVAAEHVVSRSVRDSAALLDATAGPAPGDPYWAPPPARPFIDEVGADPGKLRIAFSSTPINGVPVHGDCRAALEDAAKLCEDLGHHVEEDEPTFADNLGQTFSTVWMGMLGWTVAELTRRLGRAPEGDDLEPWTWRGVQAAQELSAADYLLAVQDTQSAGLDLALFLQRYDLWLTPTLAAPPLPVGSFDFTEENRKRAHQSVFAFAAFTPICNVAGNPAMSVPLFWNGEGLPIGVQFIAPVAEEARLFRLAAQLEEARPWADKRPPVSA